MKDRRTIIVELIDESQSLGIQEILGKINAVFKKKLTKITINRDLDKLIEKGLVDRIGSGPKVRYQLSSSSQILVDIDIRSYFLVEEDNRKINENFNFDVFDRLANVELFSKQELELLTSLNTEYREDISSLPKEIIRKEFERLLIELSWKSSQIEGNTYSLLETEFLLKEKREGAGHTKMESTMILNHKEAFEFTKKSKISTIELGEVKKVHNLLIRDMNVSKEIRSSAVGITGTRHKPLRDEKLIRKAVKMMCELVNSKKDVFSKSFLLNLLIAYIQPFNDGNKRTSRLLGNAILLANNHCPLSFRSIDDLEYKKAIILFYELNSIQYFKQLFIEQFTFAVKNYFNK